MPQRSAEDQKIVRVLCDTAQRAYGLKEKDLSPDKIERILGGEPELEILIPSMKLFLREIIREKPKPPFSEK